MKIYIIGIICLVLLSACDTKVENAIEGLWSIDTIYYRNYDIKVCLLDNLLLFSGDKTLSLPTTSSDSICKTVIIQNEDNYAGWKASISSNLSDTMPLRLIIASTNKVFSGTHTIVFHTNEEKRILEMELFSDSLYVICRKSLDPYRQRELFNELEELSWTNRHKIMNK